MNRVFGVLAVFVVLPVVVLAADSGQLPWVVTKGSLNDFKSQPKVIQDFTSEDEAVQFAKEQNAADKDGYTYSPLKRSDLQKRPARKGADQTITIPTKPFVDPGPSKIGQQPKLEGKIGKGMVGQFEVTLDFLKGNKFVFTSGLEGKGTWEATANGAIVLSTERSDFRGSVSGNKISGKWFHKDNSPMEDFSLIVQDKPSVVGKWNWRSRPTTGGADVTSTVSFSADGTMDGESRWTVDGSGMLIVVNGDQRGTWSMINADKYEGRWAVSGSYSYPVELTRVK
jgi:hypothetical protein